MGCCLRLSHEHKDKSASTLPFCDESTGCDARRLSQRAFQMERDYRNRRSPDRISPSGGWMDYREYQAYNRWVQEWIDECRNTAHRDPFAVDPV